MDVLKQKRCLTCQLNNVERKMTEVDKEDENYTIN